MKWFLALNHNTKIFVGGLASALLVLCLGMAITGKPPETGYAETQDTQNPAPEKSILRPLPETFPVGTHMPRSGEGDTSGSIDLTTFSAGRDLTYVESPEVWWESDNDGNDYEDDHSMHKSVVEPFSNLVRLVSRRGGTLKVQDAYRSHGTHGSRSLHKEGRALDVTCDQMSLEELAKLCWAAGFDWVYYENGKGGAHIHCSVKRHRTPSAEPETIDN